MSGRVEHRFGHTLKFPVENIKKYPEMFQEGEDVIITEKIHGTWCCMGRADGEPLVSSLGMSEHGLGLKLNEENRNNLYVRQWELCRRILERMGDRTRRCRFPRPGRDLRRQGPGPEVRAQHPGVQGLRHCHRRKIPIMGVRQFPRLGNHTHAVPGSLLQGDHHQPYGWAIHPTGSRPHPGGHSHTSNARGSKRADRGKKNSKVHQ